MAFAYRAGLADVLVVALVLVQTLGELDVLVLAVAFGWCWPWRWASTVRPSPFMIWL